MIYTITVEAKIPCYATYEMQAEDEATALADLREYAKDVGIDGFAVVGHVESLIPKPETFKYQVVDERHEEPSIEEFIS